MKILVADDDPNVRELLVVTLESFGYEPIQAADGEQAWAAFDLHRPRIVISDWTMPVLSGLDLCRKIREEMRRIKGSDYTYFILVTGHEPNEENYQRALDMEVDDYLLKPIKETEIKGRIRVAERILGMNRELNDLQALVPICAYCRRIRNDEMKYEPVETFLHRRSSMSFTHGICPDCRAKHFPDSK